MAKSTGKYEKEKFKLIFENSPIAIWEEDLSVLSKLKQELKEKTVTNVKKYLAEHPELVKRTFRNVKVLNINKAALEMYGVKSKVELTDNLGKTFTKEVLNLLVDEFSALINGERRYEAEFKSKSLKGKKTYDLQLKVSIPEQYKDNFKRVIVTMQDVTEHKKLERHLRKLAQLDSLTRLYNHNTINQRLDAEFHRAKRYGSSLSCLMIDVDHFKVINDHFGHPKGDQIIKKVAATLKNSLRKVDVLGRYGGDEFFVILPETTTKNAKIAAARIQDVFADKKFQVKSGMTVKIQLSIGVAGFPGKGVKEAKDLISKADKGMYDAKKAGRNTVVEG